MGTETSTQKRSSLRGADHVGNAAPADMFTAHAPFIGPASQPPSLLRSHRRFLFQGMLATLDPVRQSHPEIIELPAEFGNINSGQRLKRF